MRILILSDLYPPYYKGGHEIRCKEVSEGLSKKGHKVFVLTSRYGLTNKNINNNIFRLLYYLSTDNIKRYNKRYIQIKTAILGRVNYFITRKVIKYIRIDLVYVGQLTGVSIFPIKAIQNKNIPIVYHQGNYFFIDLVRYCILERNKIKKIYRKFIFGFDGKDKFDFSYIIVVSNAVKQRYVEAGFPEDNISIIPPRGISLELACNKGKKALNIVRKQLKLLYVGRITEEKGIHIAIESVGYLINILGTRELTLNIIGSGDREYIKKLNKLIKNLKLNEYIRFKGQIHYKLIIKEYDNNDVLLVPSVREEAFGLIILEAMSRGIPVIASNIGGIPEIIEDGRTGILVPPRNPIKMAKAIKKLIEDPSLYEQISINGINEVKEKYTNEKVINQIDNYINNLFKQSKKDSI